MEYTKALAIAEQARDTLAPYCDRIEIAGSIRRRKPDVKDIELVAIPRAQPAGLFGDVSEPDPGFCAQVKQWRKVKGEPTGKYTQRQLPEGIMLDLFIANAENWSVTLAIRTGSAEYSYRVLATGWVKLGYTSKDSLLYRGGQSVSIREEADLFALLGLPWADPWERS
jgi:DNA polymerase/3'-5' exonuclease PolX